MTLVCIVAIIGAFIGGSLVGWAAVKAFAANELKKL